MVLRLSGAAIAAHYPPLPDAEVTVQRSGPHLSVSFLKGTPDDLRDMAKYLLNLADEMEIN